MRDQLRCGKWEGKVAYKDGWGLMKIKVSSDTFKLIKVVTQAYVTKLQKLMDFLSAPIQAALSFCVYLKLMLTCMAQTSEVSGRVIQKSKVESWDR